MPNPAHNSRSTVCQFILPLLLATVVIACDATAAALTPKTSQHASFDPKSFERLAVIVKPIHQPDRGLRYGRTQQQPSQGQSERLIEQGFLRMILGKGYTVVSRADLDAIMKEKGLDQANMTDEKLTEEAGKLLHVTAIMVVSVDALKTSPYAQQAANRAFGAPKPNAVQYFQLVASVSARLVKIQDNMVLWTGDLTVNQTVLNEDQDSVILASVSEAIAAALPPLAEKKGK